MILVRTKFCWAALLLACFSLWTRGQDTSRPTNAVQVTMSADNKRIKVGERTTIRAFAEIKPEFKPSTEQIFAWYVDLLNSTPAALVIEPGTIAVPNGDQDAALSSRGTAEGPNLRAIYDTFIGAQGAGKEGPIELFSIQVRAVAVGSSTFSVAKGTTATSLEADFITSTGTPTPILGGAYENAQVVVSSFINTPPTLDAIADAQVDEGKLLTFTVLGHDSDIGQTLSYAFLGTVPTGANLAAGTGVFTWTPAENQGPAEYQFQVRVSDNGTPPMMETNSFTVTVNEVNRAPVVNVPATQTRLEQTAISLNCTVTDADILIGQTPSTNRYTFSLVGAPQGASINPNTGAFTWTSLEAQGPGSYQIRVVAIDDGVPPLAGTNTFTINLTEDNLAPALPAPTARVVAESTAVTIAFAGIDLDLPPNQLTYTLLSGPAGVILDPATGVISWTPSEAQGPQAYQIRVSVSDNANPPRFATNQVAVTVTEVNSSPVLGLLQDRSVSEGTPLNFLVTATDVDLPAQTLTYALENPPTGATINPQTGAFSWTPSEAQGPGQYTVVLRVTDNGSPARSDTKSFDVIVNETAAPPVLTVPANQANQTVPELSPVTVQFTATDPDLPTNIITFSVLEGPAGVTIDSVTGRLSWTPTEAQGPGSYDIKVVAADNGSPVRTATNTVHIDVTEVSAAPTINPIENRTVAELSPLSFTITATDTDIPAQIMLFSLLNPPAGAAITSGGLFTWTPSEAQGPGQFTITVRVTEVAAGGRSATNTFNVTVTEQNSAPVVNVPGTVIRSEVLPISLAITATDPDILNGQNPAANTITFALLNPPAGAAINPTTGGFTWSPTEAQGPGQYQIRVVATDDGNPSLSGTNTFNITLLEANRAPVIVAPANQTIQELTPINAVFQAADPDLPTNNLTFFVVDAPPGVSVNATNGSVIWTPTEAQGPGSYTIRVAVSDNASVPQFATNSFNVTVTEKTEAPIIADIPDKTVRELTTLSVAVVANDPDIPSSSLTYSLETAPSGAIINPTTGMFTWTPGAGLAPGDYIIGVKVAKGGGGGGMSDTKSFRVSVRKDSAQPKLRAVSLAAGGFTLELFGEPNTTYTLEFSTTLTNWSTVTTIALQSQTNRTYLDATHILNLNNPKGFYRIKTGGTTTQPTAASLKVLSSPTTSGVNLRITGDPNVQYRIEYTTTLPNWNPLTSITIPAGGTIDYLDAAHLQGTTAGTRGFYRAITP